jgi:hypothetical protein
MSPARASPTGDRQWRAEDCADRGNDLAAQFYDMLSRIRITGLLAEVTGWTGFVFPPVPSSQDEFRNADHCAFA